MAGKRGTQPPPGQGPRRQEPWMGETTRRKLDATRNRELVGQEAGNSASSRPQDTQTRRRGRRAPSDQAGGGGKAPRGQRARAGPAGKPGTAPPLGLGTPRPAVGDGGLPRTRQEEEERLREAREPGPGRPGSRKQRLLPS